MSFFPNPAGNCIAGALSSFTITVKNLAGDLVSVECSPLDTLPHLKRQIAAAAASELGQDWPEACQKFMSFADDDDEKSLQNEAMSLLGLNIRDGDVLAVFIDDKVSTPINILLSF